MAATLIALPWFPKGLSPNDRMHYQLKAIVFKKAKMTAWVLARESGFYFYEPPICLSLIFCPPDKRKRDLDNCHAACKAYLDGIALALHVDDSVFHPVTLDWGAPVAGGEVRVQLKAEGGRGEANL